MDGKIRQGEWSKTGLAVTDELINAEIT